MKTLFFALWIILWSLALTMASTTKRDNTTSTSTSSSDERRTSWEAPKYTDKPMFVNKHYRTTPHETIWEYRRTRKANLARIAAEDAAAAIANGARDQQENIPARPKGWMSSQRRAYTENGAQNQQETIPTRPKGWMSGQRSSYPEDGAHGEQEDIPARPNGWKNSQRFGLAEAFERVDNDTDTIPINEWASGHSDRDSDTGLRDTSPSPGPRDSYHGRYGSSVDMGTARTYERKASQSSFDDEPEPPIRIPSTWGAKARKNRDWMKKILSPDTSLELEDSLHEQKAMSRPRTAHDAIIPSVEDRSLTSEMTPPSSRPASAQYMKASPEKMWDAELDFTAQSLQISTSPQLRVKKTTKLDDIRSREIQNLTARAVATSRLEEIRERNSEERSLPSAIEEYHEKTILEEEGEPIPNTPITVFAGKDWDDYVKRNNVKLTSSTQGQDPRDTLRRLSRSLSPKDLVAAGVSGLEKDTENVNVSDPVKDSGLDRIESEKPSFSDPLRNLDLEREDLKEQNALDPVKDLDLDRQELEKPNVSNSEKNLEWLNLAKEKPNLSGSVKNSEHTDDAEERIAAEARLFEIQDKSEKGSLRAPSPVEDFDETPRPKPDPLSLPTPRVTGAYIDTPLTTKTRSRSPRPRTREYKPSSRFRDSRPSSVNPPAPIVSSAAPSIDAATPLINTATHVSAIEDVRRIQLESNVEDSTLDDLEFLEEAPPAETTTTIEPVLDLEYNDRGLPLSRKEIDRRIEEITLERMNKSLKATSTSIRDARKGIERLEKQVSSSFISVAQTQAIQSSNPPIYLNINFNIRVPQLWISQPPRKPGMRPGWKFTLLGLLLLWVAMWFILESAMCAQFCHPTNSRINTWQPSDPFFPWALPTKLDQWSGQVASTAMASVTQYLNVGWNFGVPLPPGYKGGPIGADDWWLGREGPVGIKEMDNGSSFSDDEMI